MQASHPPQGNALTTAHRPTSRQSLRRRRCFREGRLPRTGMDRPRSCGSRPVGRCWPYWPSRPPCRSGSSRQTRRSRMRRRICGVVWIGWLPRRSARSSAGGPADMIGLPAPGDAVRRSLPLLTAPRPSKLDLRTTSAALARGPGSRAISGHGCVRVRSSETPRRNAPSAPGLSSMCQSW